MIDAISRLTSTTRFACVGLLCLLAALTPSPPAAADAAVTVAHGRVDAAPADQLAPAVLTTSGAIIGSITIENGSIFNLDDPEEDRALYRLANRLHATTRPDVIEQQLLFSTGDIFSSQAIEESARILRSNRYIQEASIAPTRSEDGVVDIQVKTTDTWTLTPKINLSRSGGANHSSVGIKETNLFGSGMEIDLSYKSDVDRDSKVLKAADHNFRNSWYSLSGTIESSSDGFSRFFEVEKPFYSLDTRRAHGFSFLNDDRFDSLYDRGDQVAQYRHQTRSHEIFAGWSAGLTNGWSKRYIAGLAYDEHRFSEGGDVQLAPFVMPADRKLLYPFVGIELLQDNFDTTKNLDQISRTEDRFLGTAINARLGLSNSGLGSDRNAWIASVGARTSYGHPRDAALFLESQFATRIESGKLANLTLDMNANYYKRQSEKRLFFASLNTSYGDNLDLDQQLLLGGDSGLRGYPLRYQAGDKRALLTLEQRIFTDWYPWRLFRVGGAVFFDAGRTWGDGSIASENEGLLKDVGIGLRLGTPRSGLGNVAHIDLAFPLDGESDISSVQFLVSVKQSF